MKGGNGPETSPKIEKEERAGRGGKKKQKNVGWENTLEVLWVPVDGASTSAIRADVVGILVDHDVLVRLCPKHI